MTDEGSVYPEFIEGELKAERDRRANIESRGSAVVTQSGTLVTLLLAAASFVRGSSAASLPGVAVPMVILGVIFFLGAGVAGILVSFPHLYPAMPVADTGTLTKMRTDRRRDPGEEQRSVVSSLQIDTQTALRDGNNKKMNVFTISQASQVLGLVFIGIAVLLAVMTPG